MNRGNFYINDKSTGSVVFQQFSEEVKNPVQMIKRFLFLFNSFANNRIIKNTYKYK